MKLPAQKGHTIPGTSVVVMPPVSTDDVIYPDTLELEKPGYTPKPDSLSISVPRYDLFENAEIMWLMWLMVVVALVIVMGTEGDVTEAKIASVWSICISVFECTCMFLSF